SPHRNLASKIFCICCKCCEEANATDDSKIPKPKSFSHQSMVGKKVIVEKTGGQNQQFQTEKKKALLSRSGKARTDKHAKDELDGQNLKQDNEASHVIWGNSLLHPEKRTSYFSSSEFEDVNSRFQKRISQEKPKPLLPGSLAVTAVPHWETLNILDGSPL
ncbi:hypothetical protein EI555_017101, partial [Monodon monoceros]